MFITSCAPHLEIPGAATVLSELLGLKLISKTLNYKTIEC